LDVKELTYQINGAKVLIKLVLNVIAQRLTVFPLPLSAEEKVSVSLCESVANETKLVRANHLKRWDAKPLA
jgi:hypothetical protein